MENNETDKSDSSFDIIGFGKTARAIPPEVYVETTRRFIDTFDKIIAPLTETTSGIGRYIRQKFNNMVDVEKAIGSYTIQKAIEKAKKQGDLKLPVHLKSFINSFDEASKETNPTLHEMWKNILASQISESNFHPRYVGILSGLSANEANLLLKLNTIDNLGKDFSPYFGSPRDSFKYFVIRNHDTDLIKWSYSCNIILGFELAEVICPDQGVYSEEDKVTILYLTKSGKRFLDVVT